MIAESNGGHISVQKKTCPIHSAGCKLVAHAKPNMSRHAIQAKANMSFEPITVHAFCHVSSNIVHCIGYCVNHIFIRYTLLLDYFVCAVICCISIIVKLVTL